MMQALAIGIDVGGTKTALALVDPGNGETLAYEELVTPPLARTGPEFIDNVARHAAGLKAEAERLGCLVDGIGVGLCEVVDREGHIVSCHRIDWMPPCILTPLRNLAPVTLAADVRAAGFGEARLGHGRGRGHWLFVNAGTGIVSVLMNGDVPYEGAHGRALALGMSPACFIAHGEGTEPTVEDLAGGAGLAAAGRAAGLVDASAREIIARAAKGAAPEMVLARDAGAVFGRAIALLVNTLDPEAVVLGGGLVGEPSPYLDTAISEARRYIYGSLDRELPIVTAALGPKAGVIGAALLSVH
jgi:glucokinase